MEYEVSCGAVVFTKRENKILYVIVQSLEGYFGFPKGHMENGENEEETALREIHEETGLTPELIRGFKTSDEHPIPNKQDVIKKIIYFLASYDNQRIECQKEELRDSFLMTYEEAMSVFQFDSTKRILTQANDFIQQL